MTDAEFKDLQQLVRKLKNDAQAKRFFKSYLYNGAEITKEQSIELEAKYKQAISLRRVVTAAKTRVKEWGRVYDTVGELKKDWAVKILKEKLVELRLAKNQFSDL